MTDQPLLKRRSTDRSFRATAWFARLLLAACLLAASEIVLWTDATRAPIGWVLLLPGYIALGALLLDLLERYHVHELFGGLVVAGTYGLLAAGLLNPSATLTNLPVSLLTRVMGAQTVAGGAGLLLFFGLVRGGARRGLLVGAAVAGAFWGVWSRGYPVLLGGPSLSMAGSFGLAAAVGVTLLIVAALLSRVDAPLAAYARLTRIEWAAVLAVLVGLGGYHLWREALTRDALSYLVVLTFFCAMILWFQHRPQAPTALPDRPSVNVIGDGLPTLAVFLAAAALTYQLPIPLSDTSGVLPVLSIVFGAVGLAWLPAVCIVLAVRAYRETSRTGKLL